MKNTQEKICGNETCGKSKHVDPPQEKIQYQHNHFYEELPTEYLPGDTGVPPICGTCGKERDRLRMFRVITAPCRECGRKINLAFVEIDDVELIFPDGFTEVEVALAKKYKVYMRSSRELEVPGVRTNYCRFCKRPNGYFAMCGKVLSCRPICNIVSGYECYDCDQE